MGYRLFFMDNQTYSAQDVNEHFARLFSGGVSLLESENVLDDLNSMTADTVSYGVTYDSCRVEKTDSGYRINKGSAYMHDGSAICFDEDGYDFSTQIGTEHYVYLKRNEEYNRIDVCVEDTMPDGDIVMLAKILTDGSVSDRRIYAKLKVNSAQASTLRSFSVSYNPADDYQSEAYDIGDGNFSHFIILDSQYHTGDLSYYLTCYGNNFREISDDTPITFSLIDGGGFTKGAVRVEKTGTLINTTFLAPNYANSFTMNYAVI